MAARSLCSVLRSCKLNLTAPTKFSAKALHCSRNLRRPEATSELLKAVNWELKVNGKNFHKLPEVTSFSCSMDGAVASFQRSFRNENVEVTVDANNAVTFDMEQSDSEEEPSIPAFTVSVTKPSVSAPSGNLMKFECSFEPDYDEESDSEELRMHIDSVCIVPKDCNKSDSVLSVDTSKVGEELYQSLEKYLHDRGITTDFGSELIDFYEVFEHRAYATDFLESLKKYCSEQ